jgi:Fur family ferric uptake transcriptional regulator
VATSQTTWTKDALSALAAAGYRRGGARQAVVELLGRQNCCLGAQDIHDHLRRARRPVGIASVYRALDALVELRLVKRVDAGDGIARFEPASADGDHHHHLVCRDCGKVEAFSPGPGKGSRFWIELQRVEDAHETDRLRHALGRG